MATPSGALAGAPLTYLMPCAHCGADNGVTAGSCWRCEASLVLPRPDWLGAPEPELEPEPEPEVEAAPDPHDQALAAQEPRKRAEHEASFYPVLRQELPGEESAANDGVVLDVWPGQPPAATPRGRSRRLTLLGGCGLALALALVLASQWMGGEAAEPGAAVEAPKAVVRPLDRAAATAAPDVAPLQAPAPAAPALSTPAPPALRSVAAPPPAAKPVPPPRPKVREAPPAPAAADVECSAAVLAMGLCSTGSN